MVWIVAVCLLATGGILYKKNQQADNDLLPVDLYSLKMNDGWGYEVLVDKKIFIHQDCIPAIPSFKRFYSEAEALSVGAIVVGKIKRGHKPAVTLQEIHDAHIHY